MLRASVALVSLLGLVLVLGLSLSFEGCAASTTGTDLGFVVAGCKTPSACYVVGGDCSCLRGEALSSCKACDPTVQVCVCAPGQACLEPTSICVGRSPTVCDGVGARCLPTGSTCSSTDTGTPPQLVGSGAAFAPRCPFTDDVCCPGIVVDLGAAD